MPPDHELDSLREKRRKELLAQNIKKELSMKQQEKETNQMKQRQVRATEIVNKALEPEAVVYLNWLTTSKPAVALTIKDTIILLIQKKMLRKQLSKIDIIKIERELTGVDSKIQVKRRGQEITDLDENLKSKK
jgi:DNA-binding TFAR19-related protein (PDSD5 family)